MTDLFQEYSTAPIWLRAIVWTFGARRQTVDKAGSLKYIAFNGKFYITEEK